MHLHSANGSRVSRLWQERAYCPALPSIYRIQLLQTEEA